MLLDKLYLLVEKGEQSPMNFWLDQYREIRQDILPDLERILPTLHEGTDAKRSIKGLVSLLSQDTPNELELSRVLLHIADLFTTEDATPEEKSRASRYVQDVGKFLTQAQMGETFRKTREQQKKTLTSQAQKEQDKDRFEDMGMMYCLEYYLQFYKSIQDAPDEQEKRKYIESAEMKFPVAVLPGLWIDFTRDEVPNKFIYEILDDDVRNRLIKAYFDAKKVFMRIDMRCDEKGSCSAAYNQVTLAEVIAALRELIRALIAEFQKMGIDRLSSHFFTPYGDKPLMSELPL